jgi:hypothetical protein
MGRSRAGETCVARRKGSRAARAVAGQVRRRSRIRRGQVRRSGSARPWSRMRAERRRGWYRACVMEGRARIHGIQTLLYHTYQLQPSRGGLKPAPEAQLLRRTSERRPGFVAAQMALGGAAAPVCHVAWRRRSRASPFGSSSSWAGLQT